MSVWTLLVLDEGVSREQVCWGQQDGSRVRDAKEVEVFGAKKVVDVSVV